MGDVAAPDLHEMIEVAPPAEQIQGNLSIDEEQQALARTQTTLRALKAKQAELRKKRAELEVKMGGLKRR
jgi:small-conductance mechanosensitive channel